MASSCRMRAQNYGTIGANGDTHDQKPKITMGVTRIDAFGTDALFTFPNS